MSQIKYLTLSLKNEQTRAKKTKKNIELNQTINQDLLHGIKLHTNKKYKEAESLYNKVLITEPKNYEA